MRNRVLSWSVIVMCLTLLAGCSNLGLSFVNALAVFGDYEVTKGHAYGDHQLNTLDIYEPKKLAGSAPVVAFFYGGCWGGCTTYPKSYYRFVAEALTAQGFVVAVVDYRRYPEVNFPEIMADTSAALAWLQGNIAEHGGDPDKLFASGHSAGAHMVATAALDPRYLDPENVKLAGVIGLAGPYDFLPFDEDYLFTLFGPEANWPESQPVNYARAGTPFLLLHGKADDTVWAHNPNNLAAAVQEQGGSAEVIIYDNIDHVGILAAFASIRRKTAPVVEDIARFVRQHAAD
jgi:acetyl esterase/lipase